VKQYLLFRGDDYYPSGGWMDFYTDSDDLAELQVVGKGRANWYHIVDTTTGLIVDQDY
jgi:hypothetical protein